MILGPDWLMYLEIIGKNTLYIGIGFGVFTLSTMKWIDFLFDR